MQCLCLRFFSSFNIFYSRFKQLTPGANLAPYSWYVQSYLAIKQTDSVLTVNDAECSTRLTADSLVSPCGSGHGSCSHLKRLNFETLTLGEADCLPASGGDGVPERRAASCGDVDRQQQQQQQHTADKLSLWHLFMFRDSNRPQSPVDRHLLHNRRRSTSGRKRNNTHKYWNRLLEFT